MPMPPDFYERLARVQGNLKQAGVELENSKNKLSPEQIKYTKVSISSRFSEGSHAGQQLERLVNYVLKGNPTDVPPIVVYHVYDDYWVVDGNKRLWAYRKAQVTKPYLRIPVLVKCDKEEFKAKVRDINKSYLSLREILFMGTEIKLDN